LNPVPEIWMPAAVSASPNRAAAHKLGLGAGQFGLARPHDGRAGDARGRASTAEAMAAVALAAAAGVRLIDVGARGADVETVLGQALPAHPPEPPPFRIVVKTAPAAHGQSAVETAARASLQRLRVDRASALVIPRASDLLSADGPGIWRGLQRLKAEGLFGAVGFAAAAGEDPVGLARRFKPDLVQLPVSVLDQRLVDAGALETLTGLGVEIHLRSVFQGGLLFLPRAGLPEAMVRHGPRLSRIRRTIAEAGADPLHAALAFALSRPEASGVIVGVGTAAELRAVLAAAVLPPPPLDWSALRLDDPASLDPPLWAAA